MLALSFQLHACQASPSGPSYVPQAGETRTRPADGAAMVFVPDGSFTMGSPSEQTRIARQLCRQASGPQLAIATCGLAAFSDESPAHLVELSGFWFDRTEVTNAQYELCVTAGACTPPLDSGSFTRPRYFGEADFDDYPVVQVTRGQAQAYCTWVAARLPSEAEWEYAARGPESRLFPWGDTFEPRRLNYCDRSCTGLSDPVHDDGFPDTAPVGSFPAGASWIGALDLAGNVREWVADWYGPYAAAPAVDPAGPTTGDSYIPRGGSWYDTPDDVRSANRGSNLPDYTHPKVGFRCAAGAVFFNDP